MIYSREIERSGFEDAEKKRWKNPGTKWIQCQAPFCLCGGMLKNDEDDIKWDTKHLLDTGQQQQPSIT